MRVVLMENLALQETGADMDQSFLIVDSLYEHFTDEASYVLGDEAFVFNKPIEIQFGSIREDLSIYQRHNGVSWKEFLQ